MNLRQIQELLGHKHLDSTQRYTRVNAHELRGAISGSSLRNKAFESSSIEHRAPWERSSGARWVG